MRGHVAFCSNVLLLCRLLISGTVIPICKQSIYDVLYCFTLEMRPFYDCTSTRWHRDKKWLFKYANLLFKTIQMEQVGVKLQKNTIFQKQVSKKYVKSSKKHTKSAICRAAAPSAPQLREKTRSLFVKPK